MVSVLIEAGMGDGERLAHTLACLVPAAVEGVVREVIVVAPASAADVAGVADHAGCKPAQTLGDAIRAARGDWLLFLEPGARLREGWSESVAIHLTGGGGPARFTRDASPWAFFRGPSIRRRPLARGLLIGRGEAAALVRADGFGRRVRARRLPARIVQAE